METVLFGIGSAFKAVFSLISKFKFLNMEHLHLLLWESAVS